MKKIFLAMVCVILVLGVGGCGSKEPTTEEITKKLKDGGYKIALNDKDLLISKNNKFTFSKSYEGDKTNYMIYVVDKDTNQAFLYHDPETSKPFLQLFNSDCGITYEDANKDKYIEEDCKSSSSLTDMKSDLEKELKTLDLDFDSFINYTSQYIQENK